MFSACGKMPVIESDIEPVSITKEAAPDTVKVSENAHVDSLEIAYPPTWPDEIQIKISGNLPDGCTQIREAVHDRSEKSYTIRIFTERPADIDCTQALEPFELSVFLDTSRLEAGRYNVNAAGISNEFTVEQSRIIDDGCG